MSENTPVYPHPAPVTSDGQQYTNVFHAGKPGHLIARFYGPNHIADAKRYCDTFGESIDNCAKLRAAQLDTES